MLADLALPTSSDTTVYLVMGVVGTVLFLLKLALMLFFGMDDASDFDLGHSGAGDASHGEGFGLFSMLSIISFMMGAGWMGYAARSDWGWNPLPAAAGASGFGFGLMVFSSFLMWQMKKFNVEGKYDVKTTVGHTGRVYLEIPAKGGGTGQVEMNVDGRRSLLPAKSNTGRIESFTTVKVLEVQDGNIVLVEPI